MSLLLMSMMICVAEGQYRCRSVQRGQLATSPRKVAKLLIGTIPGWNVIHPLQRKDLHIQMSVKQKEGTIPPLLCPWMMNDPVTTSNGSSWAKAGMALCRSLMGYHHCSGFYSEDENWLPTHRLGLQYGILWDFMGLAAPAGLGLALP